MSEFDQPATCATGFEPWFFGLDWTSVEEVFLVFSYIVVYVAIYFVQIEMVFHITDMDIIYQLDEIPMTLHLYPIEYIHFFHIFFFF